VKDQESIRLAEAVEKPLRIALLTNFIAPYTEASGPGQHNRILVEGLSEAGHIVTVVGIDVHPEPTSKQSWGRIISLRGNHRLAKILPRSISNALAVRRYMKRNRRDFDVVESTSWPGLDAIGGYYSVPSVVRLITSITADPDVSRLQVCAQYILEWLSVRRASRVIASTVYIRDQAESLYKTTFRHVDLVSYGFPDVKVTVKNDDNRVFQFLSIAAANARKGTDVLLKALSIAASEVEGFTVVLVSPQYATYENYAGSNDVRRDLWDRVKEKLGDRLIVLTQISDTEKHALLAKSQYLLITSRTESFGLPVIEAMRAGTPVISSAGGALQEVVSVSATNIVYDDPEDFKALALLIIAAVQRGVDEATSRRSNARRAYEEHYQADQFIKGSLQSYKSAISARNKRH